MTSDEKVFFDILQDTMDDLKNKPTQTTILAVIIKDGKNVVFKHVPEHLEDEFMERFAKTAIELIPLTIGRSTSL
jgi:hypothetical protein